MRKLTIHPHLRSTTYVLSNKLTDLLTIPITNTQYREICEQNEINLTLTNLKFL